MDYICFMVEKTGVVGPDEKEWCEECQTHHVSLSGRTEWRRLDSGETFLAHSYELPPGAMFWWECMDIHYDKDGKETARYKGIGQWDNDDGRHLIVMLPGRIDSSDGQMGLSHRWDVDSRCSNCTLPQDRTHRCWIRFGEPPNVTVGKQGHTCSAGAGSIRIEWWHGFLTNGVLKEC